MMRDRAMRLLLLDKAPSRFERRRSGATSSIKSAQATQFQEQEAHGESRSMRGFLERRML